jgi:hypothetical protein
MIAVKTGTGLINDEVNLCKGAYGDEKKTAGKEPSP